MTTYDEILGFDYTDEGAWKEFAITEILPLYTAALKITGLSKYLREKLTSSFSYTFLEREGIQKMLLGGVTPEGEYARNSLAKFYAEKIGVFTEPSLWVALSKEPDTNALRQIEVRVEVSPTLGCLHDILSLSGNILRSAGCDLPEVDEDVTEGFIQEPERIIDEFMTVYDQLIKLSATYNYHTFFAMSTRFTPRFFLLEAYPRLKLHFDTVKELLGLEVVAVSKFNEEVYCGDQVLIGHKQGGFADSLYRLNQIAWDKLLLVAVFDTQVPALKDEYFENVKKNSGLKPLNEVYKARVYYLTDNGCNVQGYCGGSKDFHSTSVMSLKHLLHLAAPYLFVGWVDLEIEPSPRTEYEKKVVGPKTAIYVKTNTKPGTDHPCP